MPQTHLIPAPYLDAPPTAVVTLTGNVEVSPLIHHNGTDYVLFATYTHSDQDVENLYRSLFTTQPHDDCY